MQKRTSRGNLGFGQKIAFALVRGARTIARAAGITSGPTTFAGEFKAEVIGKDGKVKAVHRFKNGVTNQGLNKILNVMFDADTQLTTWYLGLISSVSFSALAAGDTAAGINSSNGWTEAGSTNAPDYDEAARPQWNPAASTAQSSVNTTTVDFTMAEAGTIKGIFLSSSTTKEGTSGTLWATGLFPGGDQVVADDDVIKITYTVNAAAA